MTNSKVYDIVKLRATETTTIAVMVAFNSVIEMKSFSGFSFPPFLGLLNPINNSQQFRFEDGEHKSIAIQPELEIELPHFSTKNCFYFLQRCAVKCLDLLITYDIQTIVLFP